jgi:hypothetical protein
VRVDLLGRPLHERPGFLRRVVLPLLGRRDDFPPGLQCLVEPWEDSDLCYLLTLAAPGRPPLVTVIGRNWFETIYRAGLTFAGGNFNLGEVSITDDGRMPTQNFHFTCVTPEPGVGGGPAVLRSRRAFVVREPDGSFRLTDFAPEYRS